MRSGDLGKRCVSTKPTWLVPGETGESMSEHGIILFSRLTCRGRETSQGEAGVFCACSAGRRRCKLPVGGGMCLPKTAAQVRSPGSAPEKRGPLVPTSAWPTGDTGVNRPAGPTLRPSRGGHVPFPGLPPPPLLGLVPSRVPAGQAGEGPTRFGNEKDARGAGHRESGGEWQETEIGKMAEGKGEQAFSVKAGE